MRLDMSYLSAENGGGLVAEDNGLGGLERFLGGGGSNKDRGGLAEVMNPPVESYFEEGRLVSLYELSKYLGEHHGKVFGIAREMVWDGRLSGLEEVMNSRVDDTKGRKGTVETVIPFLTYMCTREDVLEIVKVIDPTMVSLIKLEGKDRSDERMSLKEITDMLDVRHNNAMNVVTKMAEDPEFKELLKSSSSYINNLGVELAMDTYMLDKRQSYAVAARLNVGLMMKVIDRWLYLEEENARLLVENNQLMRSHLKKARDKNLRLEYVSNKAHSNADCDAGLRVLSRDLGFDDPLKKNAVVSDGSGMLLLSEMVIQLNGDKDCPEYIRMVEAMIDQGYDIPIDYTEPMLKKEFAKLGLCKRVKSGLSTNTKYNLTEKGKRCIKVVGKEWVVNETLLLRLSDQGEYKMVLKK